MIDFTFSPEIEAVRLKVRAFMDEQVRPQWDSIDQNDRGQVVKTIVGAKPKPALLKDLESFIK